MKSLMEETGSLHATERQTHIYSDTSCLSEKSPGLTPKLPGLLQRDGGPTPQATGLSASAIGPSVPGSSTAGFS